MFVIASTEILWLPPFEDTFIKIEPGEGEVDGK